MIWKYIPAALLVAAIFIVGPVSAVPLDGPPEDAMDRLSCLDLTPKQNQRIRQMQIELEQAVNPLRIQMFERRAELRLLWMQLDPDEKAIRAKQREVFDLRWSIQERNTDFWLRVRQALTPEQRSRFLLQAGGPERSPFPDRRPPPPGRRPPPPRRW
jgi:Spy/CpxP family protein refolding chaperone